MLVILLLNTYMFREARQHGFSSIYMVMWIPKSVVPENAGEGERRI